MQQGLLRDFELQRLTESYAASAARSALHAAAGRVTAKDGPLAEALLAASAATPVDGDGGGYSAANLAAARARFCEAVADPAFVALVPTWIRELRVIAVTRPGTGACTVATALQLWSWTMNHFRREPNLHATAIAELADVFRDLVAARCLVVDFVEDAGAPPQFLSDLCHVQAARAAAAVGGVCAELVFGYRRHLTWDAEGCATCYCAEELDELEGIIPGIASGARGKADVIEADGTHAAKAGPCAGINGVEAFTRLRTRLDACLTGARLAKDRAAAVLPDLLAGSSTLPSLGRTL